MQRKLEIADLAHRSGDPKKLFVAATDSYFVPQGTEEQILVPKGTVLIKQEQHHDREEWCRVLTPDGKMGFVPSEILRAMAKQHYDQWEASHIFQKKILLIQGWVSNLATAFTQDHTRDHRSGRDSTTVHSRVLAGEELAGCSHVASPLPGPVLFELSSHIEEFWIRFSELEETLQKEQKEKKLKDNTPMDDILDFEELVIPEDNGQTLLNRSEAVCQPLMQLITTNHFCIPHILLVVMLETLQDTHDGLMRRRGTLMLFHHLSTSLATCSQRGTLFESIHERLRPSDMTNLSAKLSPSLTVLDFYMVRLYMPVLLFSICIHRDMQIDENTGEFGVAVEDFDLLWKACKESRKQASPPLETNDGASFGAQNDPPALGVGLADVGCLDSLIQEVQSLGDSPQMSPLLKYLGDEPSQWMMILRIGEMLAVLCACSPPDVVTPRENSAISEPPPSHTSASRGSEGGERDPEGLWSQAEGCSNYQKSCPSPLRSGKRGAGERDAGDFPPAKRMRMSAEEEIPTPPPFDPEDYSSDGRPSLDVSPRASGAFFPIDD